MVKAAKRQAEARGAAPGGGGTLAAVRLAGQVRSAAGKALRGATLHLIGNAEALGGHPDAALYEPLAVTWSRPLTGFAGTSDGCWRKYVTAEVAGLTWPEFRRLVIVHNPALAESDGRFDPAQTYLLPENSRGAAGAVTWDRPLAGFGGSLYAAWQRYVAHKVAGLTYPAFKRAFAAHNPAFAADGRGLQTARAYVLPRNAGQTEYALFAASGRRGRFSFPSVPSGSYRLVANAAGCRPAAQTLVVPGSQDIALVLPANWTPPPAGPGAAGAAPGPFVQVVGDEFFLHGRPFRFIGANIRGLVYYGDGQTLQRTVPDHQRRQLRAASDMGVQVVRVFLPSQFQPAGVVAARLRSLLDLIANDFPGIYVLPALTDLYGASPFHVQGDDGFYENGLLRRRFFEGGYRSNYLPFVQAIVQGFRAEPRIFAWEIGNEIKLDRANPADDGDPNPALFIQFVHDMAATIRQLDGNHMITTGMISTRHAWLFAPSLKRQLYDTPLLDFITVHNYFYDDGGVQRQEDDSSLANALHKPFIVEEAGFDSDKCADRPARTGEDLERWFSRGARGYMNWGFMATEDMGDGDRNVGMDNVFHHDWVGLFGRYQGRARALAEFVAAWQPPTGEIALATDLAAGATVYAYDQLRVRRTPGRVNKPADDTLGMVLPGAALIVTGAAAAADDLQWWPVRTTLADGTTVEGWCAQATADEVLLGTQPPTSG